MTENDLVTEGTSSHGLNVELWNKRLVTEEPVSNGEIFSNGRNA